MLLQYIFRLNYATPHYCSFTRK